MEEAPQHTLRQVPPRTTFERLKPTLSNYGITRVSNVTHLDRIGVPVAMIARPNSQGLSVALGKGLDLMSAKVSGIMEAIESWHAENIRMPIVEKSQLDLSTSQCIGISDGLPIRLDVEFDKKLVIPWVKGCSLRPSNLPIYLPLELISGKYIIPPPVRPAIFCASSNGLAAGNNLEEALLHGICELIERDALAIWSVQSPRHRSNRRLNVQSIQSNLCCNLIDMIYRAGMDIAIWDITSDIRVATFHVQIRETRSSSQYLMMPCTGEACHPNPHFALCQALTEACQTRLNLIIGCRDDINESEYSTELFDDEMLPLDSDAVIDLNRLTTFDSPPLCVALSGILDFIQERLRIVGIHDIYYVDLALNETGAFSVIRVVIPGLEGIHEHPWYCRGERADRVKLVSSYPE